MTLSDRTLRIENTGGDAADFERADIPTDYKPFRTKIDPNKTIECLRFGARLVARDDGKETLQDCVWALLCEAAQTERAITTPRPAGYVSAYPQVYYSPGEIFALYVELMTCNMELPNAVKYRATAAALDRYMTVIEWFRFVKGRDQSRSRRILWKMAQGMSAARAAREEGYGSHRGAVAKRDRELTNIVDRLSKDIKDLHARVFA